MGKHGSPSSSRFTHLRHMPRRENGVHRASPGAHTKSPTHTKGLVRRGLLKEGRSLVLTERKNLNVLPTDRGCSRPTLHNHYITLQLTVWGQVTFQWLTRIYFNYTCNNRTIFCCSCIIDLEAKNRANNCFMWTTQSPNRQILREGGVFLFFFVFFVVFLLTI